MSTNFERRIERLERMLPQKETKSLAEIEEELAQQCAELGIDLTVVDEIAVELKMDFWFLALNVYSFMMASKQAVPELWGLLCSSTAAFKFVVRGIAQGKVDEDEAALRSFISTALALSPVRDSPQLN